MSRTTIETERLILRHWLTADSEPFAALNADPRVMEFFPSPLTRKLSDEFIDRIAAEFVSHGFGLWALELKATGDFIGFTGLSVPRFEAAFMPTVEVGWRLARSAWGNGYATEAARASIREGFERHDLGEIVSFHLRVQHAVPGRHGATADDTRTGRRLRPPVPRGRPSRAPRPVPDGRRQLGDGGPVTKAQPTTRNTGWSGAIRSNWSSEASGPVPSKNIPTSARHRLR